MKVPWISTAINQITSLIPQKLLDFNASFINTTFVNAKKNLILTESKMFKKLLITFFKRGNFSEKITTIPLNFYQIQIKVLLLT